MVTKLLCSVACAGCLVSWVVIVVNVVQGVSQ